MPFAVELQAIVGILIVILILMGITIYRIETELTFEKECHQKNGVMRRTNDGPICINKDAIVK